MEKDGNERVKRAGAGVNGSLSADFTWPDNFGGNRNPTTTLPNPVPSIHSEHTRKSSSQRSQLNVEKKRLALETERKKQALEKRQRQLQYEFEQKEIENSLKLLNLEQELQIAESQHKLGSVSEEMNLFSQAINPDDNYERQKSVAEWVNSIQEDPGLVKEEIFESKDEIVQKNDIKVLCETIADAIKSVSSPRQDKHLARNAMEKDFPYFDGNPQEWPLFYRQFRNICKLCDFSNEEIMIKLQRCLKGDAKSTVSGMMLMADNVDLVMQTLETRFGRPEYIIDGMIHKIRGLPYLKDSNFEKLIKFSSEVNNMVSIMKTLKSSGHLKNPQLMRDLVYKLPDHLRLKWGDKIVSMNGLELDLEDFSKWLGECARAACFVSTPYTPSADKFGQKSVFPRRSERILSTNEKRVERCGYCEENIHENDCPKMKEDDVEKRWQTVTEKKLCFSCLRKNHQKFKCRKRKHCGVNGCRFFHHQLLHKITVSAENDETEPERNVVYTTQNESKRVQLRVVPINLHGPRKRLEVLALCDEASTVTLIDERVANELGLSGSKESLCLQWTNEEISVQKNSFKMNVQISRPGGQKCFTMIGVRTVQNLSLPLQNIKMTEWRKYQHLKNIPIRDINNEKPVVLIGQDNIDLIVARQIRCGPENLPIASRCKLGWAIHGPSQAKMNSEFTLKAHTLHICETENSEEDLQEIIRQSFSTEQFGVLATPSRQSYEITRALKILNETTKQTGDRYETGLLWKSEDINLPESKFRAMQRLKCVERKCLQNKNFGQEYCEKLQGYETKGYIRRLSPEEAAIEGPRSWYLPHFAVENINKKKIRIVFDAASKSHGISLNDVLLAGPDLLQSLVAILWKFRQRKFGFCGDVKEMFHQVRIREEDRSSQRFLWRNLEYQRPPDVYEMMVMTFGSTCSPVCAQYVKNLNAEKYASEPDIRDAIIKKFYVDDYLDSKDTEEEAIKTVTEVCKIQKLAGFDVVNWMTNSPLIQEKFAGDLFASKHIDDGSSLHRVLGLWWDTENDTFVFKLNMKENFTDMNPTKRKVLKSVMSLYDPLGLIASFTVRGKILLQDVWRSGIQWDEKLPDRLIEIWRRIVEDLPKITKIRIPRCYSSMIPRATKIELHTFCDSSEIAFAAVSYLRVLGEEDRQVDISLVASKTRVSPLKPLSIPKLELQAAVMASRLAQTIKSELEIPIQQLFFWSDSKCVLSWIRNDGKKFKQFVAHRVGEIQERTNVADWRWVSTDFNPADEATRPRLRQKIISDEWFQGPTFLRQPFQDWPMENIDLESTENCISCSDEMKRESCLLCFISSESFSCLPDINKFSSWLKLIRTTGWCLRFVKKLRNHHEQFQKELTVEEIEEAEKIWIKKSQYESFLEDLKKIKDGKFINTQSRIRNLFPELKDGILIIGGRANLSDSLHGDTKNPIILDPKNNYTKLLMRHYHEKFSHRGVELVLNEVRQKYWVINGRSAVKSAFSHCQKCKNERAKPVPPLMGQIPKVRLNREIKPFTNVGMDYFGPIHVKIGRRSEKRWGVIFTCLAVRAIHLEIAHTLNSQSAIMAITRMISRRGQPKTIYCDNGTNMVAASKEMKKVLQEIDQSEIQNSLCSRGIDFKFIPPGAPHMGGTWERLIGSVKRIIGKNLHDQSLKEETLQTFFAEAEYLVNSRPLTRVSSDPMDIEALTPNHFLLGSSSGREDGSLVHLSPDNDCLRREWKKTQMLLDNFWKRWVRDYLPTLTKRSKWTKDQNPIKVDDVVIMVDDHSPRYMWKLGRIIRLYPGPDGRIRVVDVKTSTGQYRRPVTKLCRLDLEN